jgi:hypothetical protein
MAASWRWRVKTSSGYSGKKAASSDAAFLFVVPSSVAGRAPGR